MIQVIKRPNHPKNHKLTNQQCPRKILILFQNLNKILRPKKNRILNPKREHLLSWEIVALLAALAVFVHKDVIMMTRMFRQIPKKQMSANNNSRGKLILKSV